MPPALPKTPVSQTSQALSDAKGVNIYGKQLAKAGQTEVAEA